MHRVTVPISLLVYAQTKSLKEISDAFDHYRCTRVTIDDIGAEGKFNHYGTQSELLDFVLSRREDASRPTCYTTNLTPEQIQERYGERIIDRLSLGHNEYYSFYCYS